jgi:Undecaprenyl-phosphate glucose phosphotransferase
MAHVRPDITAAGAALDAGMSGEGLHAAQSDGRGSSRQALTGRPHLPEQTAAETGQAPRLRVYKIALVRVFQTLDAIAVFVSIALAFSAVYGISLWTAPVFAAAPHLLAGLVFLWALAVADIYAFPYRRRTLGHVATVLGATVVAGVAAVLAGAALLTWAAPNQLGPGLLGAAAAVTALHAAYILVVRWLTRRGRFSENVVIVGATQNARTLIARNAERGDLNVLGVFDDRASRAPTSICGVPVIGDTAALLAWDRLPQVDRIIITVSSTAQSRVRDLIDRLRLLPNGVALLLDIDGFNPERTSLAEIANAPIAMVSGWASDDKRAFAKRMQDIAIAGAMLLAFAPVMIVIAILIPLDSPGPIFFRQRRHGFNNEIIRVWKFRSMHAPPDRDESARIQNQVQPADPRVTRIGRFLRRSSLDELPQLFNVLAGDMSIVGPRPHAVGMRTGEVESHLLVAEYAHRHRVKPGITGWAQIHGSRGPVNTPEDVRERVRLDIEYIDRASLWLDLLIILRTAPSLLGDARRPR